MTTFFAPANDFGFRVLRRPTWIQLAVLLGTVYLAEVRAADRSPVDDEAAVRVARQYLTSEDRQERKQCLSRLESFTGDMENVLRTLRTRTYPPVKPGYYPELKFDSAKRREKYPRDLLYFIVPKSYDPTRPTGLVVFLHGGGLNTSRDAPLYTLKFATDESSPDTDRSGRMLSETGMITVGPSAPGKGESYYRWCLNSAEEYLAEVIAECQERFNIDPNRVFLFGHSMGGFGGYHQALRQPDRFASIIISSGAWDCGYWPVVRGTPLCIAQGVHDAERGERWHHTDVEFARWTHKIFTRESLDHEYHEHDGGHDIVNNRDIVGKYFADHRDLRRDPYYPHVTLASPQGFAWNYLHRVSHNRWLTLDEATDGELEYDDLVTRGDDDFDTWRLEHRRTSRRGCMIDAINRGRNRIDVTTLNVARFTVWLHPKMVDVSKPVIVTVNGKERFSRPVKPSLATALESYGRRNDWGLIYPIKIELEATD